MAISGLNKQEAITLLQKQGLSKAQQEQLLSSAGLLQTNNLLNASLVEEAVLTSQISGAKAEAVLSELGLIDAKTGNVIVVTILEFICGCVINLWLNWGVWDYSNMPFNLLGQICLPFSLLCIILSSVAIVADDWLRYWLFGEEKPHYKFI